MRRKMALITRETIGEMIASEGGESATFEADVTREAQVAASVDECCRLWGRLDILHNNVGISVAGGDAEVTEITEEAFDRVMAVNLRGTVMACKHAIPVMREQRSGAIVNISSIAAVECYPWGALEEADVRGDFGDFRHEPGGAGARADHADAPARKVHVMAPACRVEALPGKGVVSLERRGDGTVQLPPGSDEGAGGEGLSVARAQVPAGAFAIPTRLRHLVVESNVRNEPIGFGEVLDVSKNLGLQAVDVTPVALGSERVAVQVGLNVASGARIGVVPPGPAQPVGLLEDHEVGAAPAARRREAMPSPPRPAPRMAMS